MCNYCIACFLLNCGSKKENMKEAVLQLLRFHLVHVILDPKGPPEVCSLCGFFQKPGFLAEICTQHAGKRTALYSRQGQDSAEKRYAEIWKCLLPLPPNSGDFCSGFPALSPVQFQLYRNSVGVGSPEPELSSLTAELLYFIAAQMSCGSSFCCHVSVPDDIALPYFHGQTLTVVPVFV